jgi:D-serine dehydratase
MTQQTSTPGRAAKRRVRLSNGELEFLENVRALALGIECRLDSMAYFIDDEQELDLWTGAKKRAQRIRKLTIEQERIEREAA